MRDEVKHRLIEQYLLPALGLTVENSAAILSKIHEAVSVLPVVKYQMLETPGMDRGGRLWLSIDAMIHAYYYCQLRQCTQGMRIWQKRELILQPASLFGQQPLTDYIEVLEPGVVLFIGYQVLRELMVDCPPLISALLKVGIANERYYHRQIRLLQMPNEERLLLLKKEIPLFIRTACQRIVAMHMGMHLRTYGELLRKMKKKKKSAS